MQKHPLVNRRRGSKLNPYFLAVTTGPVHSSATILPPVFHIIPLSLVVARLPVPCPDSAPSTRQQPSYLLRSKRACHPWLLLPLSTLAMSWLARLRVLSLGVQAQGHSQQRFHFLPSDEAPRGFRYVCGEPHLPLHGSVYSSHYWPSDGLLISQGLALVQMCTL